MAASKEALEALEIIRRELKVSVYFYYDTPTELVVKVALKLGDEVIAEDMDSIDDANP